MKKTFIVIGHPHSGTSMYSGILRIFGVKMGEKWKSRKPINEDWEIAGTGSVDEFDDVIKKRNENHDFWGWKSPNHVEIIEEIIGHKDITNPTFICSFRDPVAIANHRGDPERFTEYVKKSNRYNRIMAEKLVEYEGRKNPSFHAFSYEKSIKHPETTVKRLYELSGLDITAGQINNAIRFINPDEGYQDVTGFKS